MIAASIAVRFGGLWGRQGGFRADWLNSEAETVLAFCDKLGDKADVSAGFWLALLFESCDAVTA